MERWTVYLILTLVFLTILNKQLQTNEFFTLIKQVYSSIQGLGLLGKMIASLSIGIATILTLSFGIPEIAVSTLFHPCESVCMIFAGRFMAALVSFWITKRFPYLSRKIKEWVVSDQYLMSIESLIKREPYKYLLLIRFSNLPAPFKNYGSGMLGVKTKCYVICSLIEISIMSVVKVFIGRQVHTALDNYQSRGTWTIDGPSVAMSAIGIAMLLYLFYKVYTTVEAAKQEAQQRRQKAN